MTNCIFYSLIFVLFVRFTIGTIKFSEVNRTFMSMYRGIFEASTVSVSESGNPIFPYYEKTLLKTYIANYLDDNLPKYVSDYKYDCTFFDRNSSNVCTSNICRDVRVSLTAKINEFYTYEKTQTFSVYQKGNLWTKN